MSSQIFHSNSFPLFLIFWFFICAGPGCTDPEAKHSQADRLIPVKHSVYQNAAVVSAHPLASRIGSEILRSGGNAIDAAVAVQFALAVCYPVAGNIGGGGFLVYRSAMGEYACLDFREKAPASAKRDLFLDDNGSVIDGKSLRTHLASGVPGTVDGMWQAFSKYSQLGNWAELIEPAIKLAENGYPVSAYQANRLNDHMALFLAQNKEATAFSAREEWKEGDTLVQKDLARTLRSIADAGRDGFYQSWVADALVSEMAENGGLISHDDLGNYTALWREPIVAGFEEFRLISMPPPSSGGIALTQLLKMALSRDLDDYSAMSAKTIHLMAEAERRVFADRAKYLGDSDYVDVPVNALIEDDYVRKRFSDFDPLKATPSDKVTHGLLKESDETTHFSIVDSFGNAVAITTTINTAYGSGIVVKGAGFLLNNEMDDFSIKPGHPNYFGLIGSEANAVEPGKRMLSSMSPTILEKSGKLYLVIGSPGGSKIITTVFQAVLNIIQFGMKLNEAVACCRIHHQWLPDTLYYENSCLDRATKDSLESMGYAVKARTPYGSLDAILVRGDGSLEAAADPRGDDRCSGF